MALSLTELIELAVIWSAICFVAAFFELRAENIKLMKENRRLKRCMK